MNEESKSMSDENCLGAETNTVMDMNNVDGGNEYRQEDNVNDEACSYEMPIATVVCDSAVMPVLPCNKSFEIEDDLWIVDAKVNIPCFSSCQMHLMVLSSVSFIVS